MKKVLIVEDDSFIRDIISTKLAEFGYEVLTATTGDSALGAIAEHSPNVVLLDLKLPDMSGLIVLSFIKSHQALQGTSVIIFSNSDDEETKMKVNKIGVDGFLPKASTDYTELVALIEQLGKA